MGMCGSMGGGAWWMACVALGVAGVCALGVGEARAQTPPAKRAAADPVYAQIRKGAGEVVIDGHGWMVIEPSEAGAAGRSVVVHLPPRRAAGVGEAATNELDGLVRVAQRIGDLDAEHATAAWWRNALYIGETDRAGGGVRVMWAFRNVGSFFDYRPLGKPEDLAPLPEGERLVELAANGSGPVALTRAGAAWHVLRLKGAKWEAIEGPWGGESPEAVRLLNWREGFAAACAGTKGDATMRLWVGKVDPEGSGPVTWELRECPLGGLAGADPATLRLAFVESQRAADDALIAAVMDAKRGCSMYSLHPGASGSKPEAPTLLTILLEAPATATLVPMAAPGDADGPPGTVAVVWRGGGRAGGGGGGGTPDEASLAGLELREVSATTGRVLYAGPARVGGAVNRRAIQSITIAGVLVGVGMLLVLVRPSGEARCSTRRADPVKRLLAAVIDYAPSAMVVALAQGRSALVLLTPSTMLGGGGVSLGELNLMPFTLAIWLTFLHTGVSEWLFGRSAGKFVMGLKVISVAGGGAGGAGGPEGRLSLWQAMTRNVVRWIAPVLAVFAMLDEHGRHPGDLAARTQVVPGEIEGP